VVVAVVGGGAVAAAAITAIATGAGAGAHCRSCQHVLLLLPPTATQDTLPGVQRTAAAITAAARHIAAASHSFLFSPTSNGARAILTHRRSRQQAQSQDKGNLNPVNEPKHVQAKPCTVSPGRRSLALNLLGPQCFLCGGSFPGCLEGNLLCFRGPAASLSPSFGSIDSFGSFLSPPPSSSSFSSGGFKSSLMSM
jgi:hypothetical protein